MMPFSSNMEQSGSKCKLPNFVCLRKSVNLIDMFIKSFLRQVNT